MIYPIARIPTTSLKEGKMNFTEQVNIILDFPLVAVDNGRQMSLWLTDFNWEFTLYMFQETFEKWFFADHWLAIFSISLWL